MTVVIKPSKAKGIISAPPSKSAAHRALICGALSEKSVIKNIAYSEDIKATLRALRALGAEIEEKGEEVIIGGLLKNDIRSAEINCSESGSTLRFIIPIAMLFDKKITLTGEGRLLKRPQDVFKELFEKMPVTFKQNENNIVLKGPIKSGKYRLRGDVSSQFISGLLFALPNAKGNSEIELTTALESSPYIDLTREILREFGIETDYSDGVFSVKSGKFQNREFVVEGDYSNAAVYFLLNEIGGEVDVKGLKENSSQGDSVCKEYLRKLKENKNEPLDLSDCPDLAPVLFAAAAVFGGGKFVGTKRLKIKESDRIATMREELKKFGINLIEEENSVIVEKGTLKAPTQPLCGHNDHRIVMAMTALSTITGGEIRGAEAIAKSYPDFFEKLKMLSVSIEEKGL